MHQGSAPTWTKSRQVAEVGGKIDGRRWGATVYGVGLRDKTPGARSRRSAPPTPLQIAKATRTQALTWFQSRSLRWPITVNSERCVVSTYALKYDSARRPANCQSIRTQSVEVVVLGNLVVRMPTRTSGRSTRYVLLAITTAGRTLVSRAPASTPTTTSPGFNAVPLTPRRQAASGKQF